MSAQSFKILVTGPFAAGKTSMIQSEIDPDSGREVVVEILLTLLASMESTKAEVA